MTKSQCYSEIARNERIISECNEKITLLNKDITELIETKAKIASMKSVFGGCQSKSLSRLFDTVRVIVLNSKIVNKFCNHMSDFFTGSDFGSIASGLAEGITAAQDEINKKKREIERLKKQIAACRRTIANMYATIERIEAEERARAEAEAQARAEAETLN